MTVHQFIQSGRPRWKQLDEFIAQASRMKLSDVPLTEFEQGSLVYRETLTDLGYARTRFPKHAVVKELEQLLGRAHSTIYQALPVKQASWSQFWLRKWPRLIVEAAGPIALATGIFWAAALLGFFLAIQFPVLESFFISPPMRAAMDSGHLWTERITSVAPQASSDIATNNISVCILAWALGVSFGLGTIYLLITNGLMLGVISAGCLRAGLLSNLLEFVVAHGSLELPAIWISAGAGLILGQALAIPSRYSRSVELRRAGTRSVEILIGTIPMLLIAGFVEGFVSPSNLPALLKVALALALAAAYAMYILTGARLAINERVAT